MKTETFVSAKSYLKDFVNQVITVDPKILEIDKTNPNYMTKKKIKSLANVIEKYGWLYPIIINTDGKIIDGHQRLQAAQLLEINPTVLVTDNEKEVDRKFLRQWLNKFRGTHDTEMDITELEYLFADETGAVMMEDYMDFKESNIDDMKKLLDSPPTADFLDKAEPTQDKKRRIILFFTAADFKTVRKKLDDLMEKYGVMDEAQAIMKLLDETT